MRGIGMPHTHQECEMQELDNFIVANDGHIVDLDHVFAGQCVDLVDLWGLTIGAPLPAVPSAKDFAGMSIAGYTWVQNTPEGVPDPGDVVVFNTRIGGPHGHTSVFVQGDTNSFVSFDQNFPTEGAPCARVTHNYDAVEGWQHVNRSPVPTPGIFTGAVSAPEGAHVRTLPGVENPIVPQPGSNPDVVDRGIVLAFNAWTHHGPPIPDAITGQGDDRWFQTTAGHWIASAMINGNPPASMGPVPDPNP